MNIDSKLIKMRFRREDAGQKSVGYGDIPASISEP